MQEGWFSLEKYYKEITMDIVSKFYTPGVVYLLTLASGVWLSYIGRPLNSMIFTIHKLIAVGAVILAGRQVLPLLKSGKIETLVIVSLVVVGNGRFRPRRRLNCLRWVYRSHLPARKTAYSSSQNSRSNCSSAIDFELHRCLPDNAPGSKGQKW